MANKTIPQLNPITQGTISGTELIPVAQGTSDLKIQINQIPHNLIYGLNVGDYLHFSAAEKASFTATKATTIGTGGDYATIGTALLAGKVGTFLLLSNVTETANTSLITGSEAPIYIKAKGKFIWNLSTYTFAYAAIKHVFCDCTNPNFITNTFASRAIHYGTNVILSSTSTYFQVFNRCNITMPNASVLMYNSIISESYISGGGTSSKLDVIGQSVAGGTSKSIGNNWGGTWNASIGSVSEEFSGNFGDVTGTISVSDKVRLSNNRMPNIIIAENDISGTKYVYLDNSNFATVTAGGGATVYFMHSNCKYTTTATISNGVHSFSNCIFDASVVLPNTTTSAKFFGCRFGINLTINSGAAGVKLYGKTVVGTYTDNGTATIDL